MMFGRKKSDADPDSFWQEYEEKTGEKVLARSLGQYISGLEEFDNKGWKSIWGLLIATSGGFRFHHFPQHHWMDTFSRNRKSQEDKIFFLPREQIISVQLIKETNWLKRIFSSPAPQLIVKYRSEGDVKKRLLLEADLIHGDLIGALST
jgi:hypothetical protein